MSDWTPTPRRDRRPGRRIVAVATAIALGLGAVGGVVAWRAYASARQDARDRIRASTGSTAADIIAFVQGRAQILEALASATPIRQGDVPSITARVSRLRLEELGFTAGIVWADSSGRVRAAAEAAVPVDRPAPAGLRETIRAIPASGAPVVSGALFGAPYREPLIAIAVATRDTDGRANGALMGLVGIRWMNGTAQSRQEQRGGLVRIVDRGGRLFISPGLTGPRDVADAPLLRTVRRESAGAEGIASGWLDPTTDIAGDGDRLVGWAVEPATTGWTVFTDTSSSGAAAEAKRTFGFEMALVTLLVALGIGGAAVLGRRVDAERQAALDAEARTRQLQAMTAALSAAVTPDEVVDAVLQLGREASGASAGSVAVLSRDGRRLETRGLVGYSAEVAETFPAYPVDARLPIPDSLRDGPLWLRSADEVVGRYPDLVAFHSVMSHEAVCAIPLIAEGRPFGGLAFSYDGPRAFGAEERAFLTTIAEQCAQALERARLHEAEHRDAERQQFLADAGVLLATPLDPRETLAALARLAVPRVADWCSVAVRTPEGIEVVETAHADRERLEALKALQRALPPRADAATGAAAVIRTGRPEFIPVVTPDVIAAAVPQPELRGAANALGLTSAVTVPLMARGRTLGALTLASSSPGRAFDEDDLEFAVDLGVRAGLALDNAGLLERTRHVARTLQDSLLPARLPDIPGLEVAAHYAAGGEGVDVGGDFYDLFPLPGDQGWAAVLGDVCGRGPEAAALTGLARHTVRAESDLLVPSAVLMRLNGAVLRYKDDLRFLTVAYAWLRIDGDLVHCTIACGGHPPPVVLRAGGAVEVVPASGTLVGVTDDAWFEDRRVTLAAGDALVLYTDGVTEARSPDGDFFAQDGLTRALARAGGGDAAAIAGMVLGAVDRFQGEDVRDDLALLVIRMEAGDVPLVAAAEPAAARGDR